MPPPKNTIPIVAMTANVMPEQVRQFMQAGMDAHVGKPIHQPELKAAIHKILLGRSGEQAKSTAADGQGGFDPEIYQGIRTLLPPERLRVHLENFDGQLAAVFGGGPMAEDLEQAAHKLVSQAGMLGFTSLSDRCREVEQACANGQDASEPFGRAEQAASEARAKVAQLLRDL
jgi:HPt (histidine-containing phosphotransfer) domain-containing protein